jgi:hypothetical protein
VYDLEKLQRPQVALIGIKAMRDRGNKSERSHALKSAQRKPEMLPLSGCDQPLQTQPEQRLLTIGALKNARGSCPARVSQSLQRKIRVVVIVKWWGG